MSYSKNWATTIQLVLHVSPINRAVRHMISLFHPFDSPPHKTFSVTATPTTSAHSPTVTFRTWESVCSVPTRFPTWYDPVKLMHRQESPPQDQPYATCLLSIGLSSGIQGAFSRYKNPPTLLVGYSPCFYTSLASLTTFARNGAKSPPWICRFSRNSKRRFAPPSTHPPFCPHIFCPPRLLWRPPQEHPLLRGPALRQAPPRSTGQVAPRLRPARRHICRSKYNAASWWMICFSFLFWSQVSIHIYIL